MITGLTVAAVSVTAQAVAPTVAIEQTYLKAAPGRRAALIRFIEQNWFVMDEEAVRQGLFTSYAVYEGGGTDWDVMVTVGYPDARGYDAPGTAAAFEAIRARHRTVLIDGRGLRDLGTIVGSRRLRLGAHR